MSAPQKNQEKRKHLRHPIHAPIHFSLDREKGAKTIESRDLSLGGLSFLYAQRLSRGNVIQFGIPVKQQTFEVTGRVVYSKEDRKTGRFRTGISFVDASSTFTAKLAEEALEILEYQKKISKERGLSVSEEEAAGLWIQDQHMRAS